MRILFFTIVVALLVARAAPAGDSAWLAHEASDRADMVAAGDFDDTVRANIGPRPSHDLVAQQIYENAREALVTLDQAESRTAEIRDVAEYGLGPCTQPDIGEYESYTFFRDQASFHYSASTKNFAGCRDQPKYWGANLTFDQQLANYQAHDDYEWCLRIAQGDRDSGDRDTADSTLAWAKISQACQEYIRK